MIRVLLVDDDTGVLDGLRRSLYCMRGEWRIQFAESGEAALELLEREPVDVVVSDMRMRGMDGSQLLAEVKRLYPETVRLILSGHAAPDLVIRATGAAHQYLAKPCDAAVLKAAITRSQNLKTLLSSETLSQLVGPVDALPSPPRAYQELQQCLNDPASSMHHVTRIICRDAALTANVLKLSNSAFFGIRNPVRTVERAIEFIGIDAISALVLGYGTFSANTPVSLPGFSLEALAKHSIQTAACARAIARCEKLSASVTEAAFLAGVLHDVGRMVFAIRKPPAGTPDTAEWSRQLNLQMEAHHAEVGAYLLGLWGFSDTIIEAIAWHHTPSRVKDEALGLCGLLHVAECFAHEYASTEADDGSDEPEDGYLEAAGLTERWTEWRQVMSENLLTESA